jgi:hypothetical protein
LRSGLQFVWAFLWLSVAAAMVTPFLLAVIECPSR